MKKSLTVLIALCMLLCGCVQGGGGQVASGEKSTEASTELGGFDDAFGETLSDGELYENLPTASDLDVTYVSGTKDCYTLEGDTLTFSGVNADTVYAVSGSFVGRIVIDAGAYKFDLELCGVSLACETDVPITVTGGNEVSLTAKKDTENFIYDLRDAVGEEEKSGAVHSEVDLEICGKGALTVVSQNNNGIHGKDDLQVKNLTLFVHCADNALKGNDSVELTDCNATLIATAGDGIKTSASDLSDKGNQRGDVTVTGGEVTVYAACDGIDAAHDVCIDGETTVLNIYTDKYSSYSTEVTATDEEVYYIRISLEQITFSVKFTDADGNVTWEDAVYHSSVSGGRSQYRYYTVPKHACASLQVYLYEEGTSQSQEEEYLAVTESLTPNAAYDTVAFTTRGNSLSYGWTNYTTSVQGGGFGGPGGGFGGGFGGGMQEGNSDKGDHSTKGIKAANAVTVQNGTVTVKAYDDAIHANSDTALENGVPPLGNVTVSGGVLVLYSNDDGLHADGELCISGGDVRVLNSYEGMEGAAVSVTAGNISVVSSDDGINSTATSGEGVCISGGTLYIYAGGDGIDANSRDSYKGIVFSGGDTVVVSTSGGNSAIDTERGYAYEGGRVLALMPSGGMTSEATNCSNFSAVATKKNVSASGVLCVSVSGDTVLELKLPNAMSGVAIYLGSNSASFENGTGTATEGASWK